MRIPNKEAVRSSHSMKATQGLTGSGQIIWVDNQLEER
jgi:hypothetical protein